MEASRDCALQSILSSKVQQKLEDGQPFRCNSEDNNGDVVTTADKQRRTDKANY